VGLVKLGHVSLDGAKVRANVSKHNAMSYALIEKSVVELEAEVKRLLPEAEATDEVDDGQHGKRWRGEDLPEEVRFKQRPLLRIKEVKAFWSAKLWSRPTRNGYQLFSIFKQ